MIDSKIALISAGVNNRFDHPHDEVISYFLDRQTDYYVTNQVGEYLVNTF